jgi:myo-inositol-1-phosphate synthase
MKKIKIAIAGVGNCSSSLVQGINYYKYGVSYKPAAKATIGYKPATETECLRIAERPSV